MSYLIRTNLTLLIIDDDEDDREMFMEVVNEINEGVECLKAANGFEALQLLSNRDVLPDFIFLDLNMPRMNGMQCLLQLKKNDRLKSIPVIIFTTSKNAEDKEQAKRLGAIDFITKPSSMISLKKELENIFAKSFP